MMRTEKLCPSAARRLLPSVPLFESPFFDGSWREHFGERAYSVAVALREQGFALIDIDEPHFDDLVTAIIQRFEPHYPWDIWREFGTANMRVQDAWKVCEEVRDLASLTSVIDLLTVVYGRPMFPFQTLNFSCGSQQHLHADAVHFNTQPDGWMCGVWVALEDVDEENGPLMYAPGSQRWKFAQNLDIGLQAGTGESNQARFHDLWDVLVRSTGVEIERFLARKGQALIWSAHLLHGGAPHLARDRTRWSQVTHYFGEGCIYLTPMHSNAGVGPVAVRSPVDIRTGAAVPNSYLGRPLDTEKLRTFSAFDIEMARETFDAASYLRFNPDVADAEVDAFEHYIKHGQFEGRRVR